MKNILITFPNAIDPTTGGLEKVYHNLTPYLRSNGYSVYAVYRVKSDYDSHSVYTDVFYSDDYRCGVKYIRVINQVIQSLDIHIVICPFQDFRIVRYLSAFSDVKVVHHIHNIPSAYLLSKIHFLSSRLQNTLLDKFLRRIRFYIRLSKAMDNIARNNQKIVILSESFRDDLKRVFQFDQKNVVAIPNPFPLDASYSLDDAQREKVILYVGRISEIQKRISSLLNIWQKLQDQLPDYRMDIVGGGPDKESFENRAKDMNLKRINFYGFKQPDNFYRKSVISCMTSNYEGFGMVLVEAMQYGCVPFAFDSFTSVHDIIDDGRNGFIIKPFDEDKYAKRIVEFINYPEEKKILIRKAAIAKSSLFDVEKVGVKWLDLLSNFDC